MIRALHVINWLELGGAETLLMRLCQHLPEYGVEPVVATMRGRGRLRPAFEALGTTLIDLSVHGHAVPWAPYTLVRAIREYRIDIVHTHLVHAGIAGKIAAVITGRPVVTTRHYTSNAKHDTWLYRLEHYLTRRYAARVVAVGEQVREHVVSRGLAEAERVVVHRNAVDLAAFPERRPHAPDREIVIGMIGRFHPVKAHEVFLEAMAHLRSRQPRASAVIVGSGQRRAELEALSQELGLDAVVRFRGPVSHEDIPALLAGFDLFVLSSDWEGLPMVLIEAAAAGLPIVATDVGGVGEVVHDGVTGYLVPPREPRKLADALARMIEEPDRRLEMGRRARARAESQFDIRRLAKQTADLYREVLERA